MPAKEPPSIPTVEISCHQLVNLMNDPSPEGKRSRLVDCREVDELKICAIEDSEHCPLSSWGEFWRDRFTDPDESIIILCHHGMRSLRATVFLRDRGFDQVLSLAGGIEAWATEIDPSMPRY